MNDKKNSFCLSVLSFFFPGRLLARRALNGIAGEKYF
jgi:hypothetical protein